MKVFLIAGSALASLVGAAKLPTKIGSYCDTPEGTGTCMDRPNCEGISYTEGYCPGTPANIQCCVPKKCKSPHTNSFCRNTSQGCPGGAFDSGNYCPGGNDIQCCVQTPEADAPSCSNPAENTCTFYPDCLEAKTQCGKDGYPIGYGLKYCKLFTDARPQFSPLGQDWVTDTMLCLQRHLVPYATGQKQGTCADLKSFAFGTHPGCYVSSGPTGVCALPPSDWGIIIRTVSLQELFGSADALKATLQTGLDCVEFYKWLIKQGVLKVIDKVGDVVEDVGDAIEDAWDTVTDWF